jgi:hypothetical protein
MDYLLDDHAQMEDLVIELGQNVLLIAYAARNSHARSGDPRPKPSNFVWSAIATPVIAKFLIERSAAQLIFH